MAKKKDKKGEITGENQNSLKKLTGEAKREPTKCYHNRMNQRRGSAMTQLNRRHQQEVPKIPKKKRHEGSENKSDGGEQRTT